MTSKQIVKLYYKKPLLLSSVIIILARDSFPFFIFALFVLYLSFICAVFSAFVIIT